MGRKEPRGGGKAPSLPARRVKHLAAIISSLRAYFLAEVFFSASHRFK
jgi:hypothetical protein